MSNQFNDEKKYTINRTCLCGYEYEAVITPPKVGFAKIDVKKGNIDFHYLNVGSTEMACEQGYYMQTINYIACPKCFTVKIEFVGEAGNTPAW